jgi:hypothetical protein
MVHVYIGLKIQYSVFIKVHLLGLSNYQSLVFEDCGSDEATNRPNDDVKYHTQEGEHNFSDRSTQSAHIDLVLR